MRAQTGNRKTYSLNSHGIPPVHRPIAVLGAGGLVSIILVNALAKAFPGRVVLIQETPLSPLALMRRRARRLGWPVAAGQFATSAVSRLTKSLTKKRMNEILAAYGHTAERDRGVPLITVPSVNDAENHAVLASMAPAVVLTISCRLLSKETLAAIPCPVINFHAGINPRYRGQMGCYWALAEGDPGNFGATIHLVDAGVDTGQTLHEVRAKPAPSDTMATYQLLVTAAGAEKVVQTVREALAGELKPCRPEGESRLLFPPTLWRWLWNGLRRGVW